LAHARLLAPEPFFGDLPVIIKKIALDGKLDLLKIPVTQLKSSR
jgi:hypothetical protein